METLPAQTVEVWKDILSREGEGPSLDSTKLIPALVRYNQLRGSSGGVNHAIEFLEHVVRTQSAEPTDKAIHNYLVLLHAQQDSSESLLEFLKDHASTFDLEYALRVCTEHNQVEACVHIYRAMGLYEEAVQLALKSGQVELAKENAESPEEPEVRKRLWLMVAQHTIEAQHVSSVDKGVQSPMQILEETDLLKIEDILPYFKDFVTIDDFRKDIVGSLEDYDKDIEDLKLRMDKLTEKAREIHKDIEKLEQTPRSVDPQSECVISGRPIQSGPFYVFPSGYACLADELYTHVLPHLPQVKQDRAKELNDYLRTPEAAGTTERELYQMEFDNLIAAECPLTGTIMIESIDKPLVDPEKLKAEKGTWRI